MHKIEDMSDSQLEDHLRGLAYQLGVPMPKTIELKAVPGAPQNENPQETGDSPGDGSALADP